MIAKIVEGGRIMDKPRLSIQAQIEHMQSQGITFESMSVAEAAEYLEKNTYYFKLKAYAKLYPKFDNPQYPEKYGKYIGLDFAYLKDLSIIDTYLRKFILRISLDIEHYLKATMIRDFNKTDCDGYEIVRDFIACNPEHYQQEFEQKKYGKACSNLIQKYEGNFALWNFIEVIGFLDFQELYKFFYARYGNQLPKKESGERYQYLINPVRILRNAAAHNNCLINSLKTPYVPADEFNRNHTLSVFLGKNGIKNRTLNTNMQKPLVHDFCVMLYLYFEVAPEKAKHHMFQELMGFFNGRMVHHKDYYYDNTIICSAYEFTKKVVELFGNLTE